MGFKRLDDSTVIDDDGNKYFMPGPPDQEPDRETIPPANDPDPARQDPKDKTIEGLLSYLNRSPADEIEMPEDNLNVPKPPAIQDKEEIAPLAAEAAAHETAPPVPLTPQEQRDAAIKGDLSAFTKGGNTLDSDREVAEAQGGIADEQAQSAMVKAKGAEDINQAMNEAAVAKADAANKAATALTEDAQKHYKEAEDKTAAWEKDVKEASKAIVDPNRAFTTMGGFGKAMWALQFIGAGMQGGQQVTATWGVLQKVLQDDIEAQRSTNANRREGLASEGQALRERIANTKELDAVNAKAMALRLDALNKALDARIKSIGQDAARKAGLLDAQVAINQGSMKLQMTVREQNLKKAEELTKQKFEIHKQALQGDIERINKDAEQRHALANSLLLKDDKGKDKRAETIAEEASVPTGELGLTAVNRQTGKEEPAQIHFTKDQNGEKARSQLASAAEAVSLGKEIQARLKSGTSLRDAKMQSLIHDQLAKAVYADSGAQVNDTEFKRKIKSLYGVDITGDSVTGWNWDMIKTSGNWRDSAIATLEQTNANLPKTTLNKVKTGIDGDDLAKYDIKYNPKDQLARQPEARVPTEDEAAAMLAEGAPKTQGSGDSVRAPIAGAQSRDIDENTAKVYSDNRENGRGPAKDQLPELGDHDEKMVDNFKSLVQTFKESGKLTPTTVNRFKQEALANPKLGDEAKFEIGNEAWLALEALKAKGKRAEATNDTKALGTATVRRH